MQQALQDSGVRLDRAGGPLNSNKKRNLFDQKQCPAQDFRKEERLKLIRNTL